MLRTNDTGDQRDPWLVGDTGQGVRGRRNSQNATDSPQSVIITDGADAEEEKHYDKSDLLMVAMGASEAQSCWLCFSTLCLTASIRCKKER